MVPVSLLSLRFLFHMQRLREQQMDSTGAHVQKQQVRQVAKGRRDGAGKLVVREDPATRNNGCVGIASHDMAARAHAQSLQIAKERCRDGAGQLVVIEIPATRNSSGWCQRRRP